MARKMNLWGLLTREVDTLTSNQLSLISYFKWLKTLCMSIFDWQGLPDTINLEYLEETLFQKGTILFFKDEALGYLALSCIPGPTRNVYGEAVSYDINVPNYTKTGLNRLNAVLIKNNQLAEPSMHTIADFAGRLSKTERTIDINVEAQKTPIVMWVESDKMLLTLKNAYKQYDDGAPVLFFDKAIMNADSLKVLKTDAPYVVDKLDTHKMNLWNEALTYIGINNANTDKKERLITDEVNANEQLIKMSANTMLITRQKAAIEINKMFGLNVSVSLKSFDEILPDENFEDEDQGVDQDE